MKTLKSMNTLKAFSSGLILTSNLYCTSIPIQLYHLTRPLNREFHQTLQHWDKVQKTRPAPYGTFTDLDLNTKTQKALSEDFGYREMSLVQQKVLSLKDADDLLVKAKTGTGKTLAFMIAAIEKVLKSERGFQGQPVSIVVLSPTRELALQIAAETTKLVKHHRLIVHTAVGGMPRVKNVSTLTQSKVDILVGTPGRINDIFSEPAVQKKVAGVKVLIFDEADQLLDMGFKREIEIISSMLPPNRTTLMFSATLTPVIKEIASKSLGRYTLVDLVPKNEVDTHLKIKQSYTITPYKDQMYMIYNIIKKHRDSVQDAKIIVFYPATFVVQHSSEVFNNIPGFENLQIHSKMDQRQRMRVSEKFRAARSAILFTTDVSARGVDYPGVTLVLQVGMPTNREQYIHRIGRTGRADKSGEAIMILSPYEEKVLTVLNDLPVRKNLDVLLTSNRNPTVMEAIAKGIRLAGRDSAFRAFIGMLGFQISHIKTSQLRKETAVELAKSFCLGYLQMPEFPSISPKMAQNLGISTRDGIAIGNEEKPVDYIHKPAEWVKKEISQKKSIIHKLKRQNLVK